MVDTSGAENPRDYGLTEKQAQRIAARYRLSPSQFKQRSEQTRQQILSRIRYGDLPRQRAEFLAHFHRGDNGEIAPDGFTRAADRLMEMRTTLPSALRGRVAGMSVGPLPAPPIIPEQVLGPTGWASLGPGNIGGRIRSMLITNPSGQQKIYIGSVGGGIRTTTDGGQSWQPADDLMANLAVCSMAMVPTNPTTIYAGTGEGYRPDDLPDDEIQGNGIFKTTDGRTWQQLANTKATDTNKDFLWVNAIATNSNGTVVLAGTRTGIFRSTDGGSTWNQRLSAKKVGNILFNPTDDNQCIAGMLVGGGIYYSVDGGSTWTQSSYPAGSPTTGRIQVCYAAAVQDPRIVYASVEIIGGGSQIWRSTDGGQSFTKRANTTDYLAGQGWYDNIIWAGDPNHSDFVIVGGTDLHKSTDGGNTIVAISNGLNVQLGSAHYDHHMILADPRYDGTSNKIVYFCNDGGLYKTDDVTMVGDDDAKINLWKSLNSKLPITQFYSVSGKFMTIGNWTTISSIVGGSQDNGTLRYTPLGGTNNWNKWARGDGGDVVSDPIRANIYYGEAPYLAVFRSTDGGSTAEDICGFTSSGTWKPRPYCIPDAIPDPQTGAAALFIAPLIRDNGPDCLIAGGASLWRTTDPRTDNTSSTGPSWSQIKPPVGTPADKVRVSAIAIAPGYSSRILVGYSNGQIYMTQDTGGSWWRADSGIAATRMCTSLAIDNDNSRLYATFGGFQTNNIWTSANSGSSWTSLGAALPPAPIYCVTIHPQNSQWLYLGTETGIFASENGGQTWSPTNQGPTNCLVYQFAWMGNTLCCATHGRGIFAIDLTQANLVLTGDVAGNLVATNAQTGAPVSSYPRASGQITAQPLVNGTSVYCAYKQPFRVVKFNNVRTLSSPTWEAATLSSVNATPCLVRAIPPSNRDVLYSFGSDGILYSHDASTGAAITPFIQVVPQSRVGTGVTAYCTQTMNQWIYIATDKGLYAVNPQATPALAWSTIYVCTASPLFMSDTLFAPAESGKIYSIQARTGVENWSYDTGLFVGSMPVWVDGSVIAGNQGGKLVGLDGNTGALQFSQTFSGEQIQAIAADGNRIYFAGNASDGHLYAYDVDIRSTPRSISQKWRVSLAIGSMGPPQIAGTSLYLTTQDPTSMAGLLRAFDTTNGQALWQRSLPGIAVAAPALAYVAPAA
jgi:photosystem II stability/assembly factor-like uncharacterized protein